jgi:acyl-CoA thioester hydrolase
MARQENFVEDYPVVIQLPVQWGHMDAFRHVNNVMFFRYFESARIAYGDRIKMSRFMEETGIGPILAETSCKFIKPLTYPDTIQVGVRISKLTDSEMEQEYAVFSERLGKMAAVGTARIVAYDYRQLRRSAFPDALLRHVLELEKELEISSSVKTE